MATLQEIFSRVKGEILANPMLAALRPVMERVQLSIGCPGIELQHGTDLFAEGLADSLKPQVCIVRTDLDKIPENRAEAIVWHEFGHIIMYHTSHFDHSENDANDVVRNLFGVHTFYTPVVHFWEPPPWDPHPFLIGFRRG